MCSVSFIGDTFRERFPQQYPGITVPDPAATTTQVFQVGVSRAEFDALKREVELMRELLVAAKKYDEEHGEPDCEMAEKVELLKRVADLVGVDLSEVFG